MERLNLVTISFWVSLIGIANFHLWKNIPRCFGCIADEKKALIEIIDSTTYLNGTIQLQPNLKKETDCCTWTGVICDNITGRVVELSLGGWYEMCAPERVDFGYCKKIDWYLNATFLLPFQQLKSLDMMCTCFAGWIEGEALKRWSGSRKLKTLDLSFNSIRESEKILKHLEPLSNLRTLSLRANYMQFSTIGFNTLSTLQKLERLDLHDNYFNDSVIPYVTQLKSLRSLDISLNSFSGPLPLADLITLKQLKFLVATSFGCTESNCVNILPIPPEIEEFTSLRGLSLGGNNLNDSRDIQALCKLKNLHLLNLADNDFSGKLPLCLSNLSNLKVLDISDNNFYGPIPYSLIGGLKSLECIRLSSNQFSGIFQLSSISNHSNLKSFELVSNYNTLEIDTKFPTWLVFESQLKILRLSDCIIDRPTSFTQKFLYNQSELRSLKLAHNNLEGELLFRLLESNKKLSYLNLMNNSLRESISPLRNLNNSEMSYLDISDNHFYGQVPLNISDVLPYLNILNMSRNSLCGHIPPSIGDLKELRSLDLSDNNLTGEVPKHLANCVLLNILKLSGNRLTGRIFSSNFKFNELEYLLLDKNQFSGEILPSLFNSYKLVMFNIAENYISGELPSQFGELSKLAVLILRGNRLQGEIPTRLCNLNALSFLDLSMNNLSGFIPSCLNFSSMKYMHLGRNRLFGKLPRSLTTATKLVTLDVTFNHIQGSIPSWIHGLSNLRVILLKGNQLRGKIPTELCNLTYLHILDLSYNNISGIIPSCFNVTTFGGTIALDDYSFDENQYGRSFKFFWAIDRHIDSQLIGFIPIMEVDYKVTAEEQEVEFVSKSRSESYKGKLLNYMTGIDLSSNKLIGNIPPQIGFLSGLRALNLSNNFLTGPIPSTFSNLKNIESLDLSHNKLTGQISSQLNQLHYLGVFRVAYNNLIGPIPVEPQLGTFPEDSYEGNPMLCGKPLKKSCFVSPTSIIQGPKKEEHESGIDTVSFYGAFIGSYLVFFISTVFIFFYSRRSVIPCIDSIKCLF